MPFCYSLLYVILTPYLNRLKLWMHSALSSLQALFIRFCMTPSHIVATLAIEMNVWSLNLLNVEAKQPGTGKRQTRGAGSWAWGMRNAYELLWCLRRRDPFAEDFVNDSWSFLQIKIGPSINGAEVSVCSCVAVRDIRTDWLQELLKRLNPYFRPCIISHLISRWFSKSGSMPVDLQKKGDVVR